MIKKIQEALSSRSDVKLAQALLESQKELINRVNASGAVAVALELRAERWPGDILNRLERDADRSPKERLAYEAGGLQAYGYLLGLIADRQEVDEVMAKLLANKDGQQTISIHEMILKVAYGHGGAAVETILDVVARTSKVEQSCVQTHLQKLLELKLLEPVEIGSGEEYYRTTHFGTPVLSRLYDLVAVRGG